MICSSPNPKGISPCNTGLIENWYVGITDVGVGVGVGVGVSVVDGVIVTDGDGVMLGVTVTDGVGVEDGVVVEVTVTDGVGVGSEVTVGVGVGVKVSEGVGVGVDVASTIVNTLVGVSSKFGIVALVTLFSAVQDVPSLLPYNVQLIGFLSGYNVESAAVT